MSFFEFFNDPLGFIHRQGEWFYLITFIWTFLEGETFVIFAGLAAHQGALDIRLVFMIAWIGSFAGDNLYFFLGRRYGTRLLRRFPRWQPKVNMVLGFLERWNMWFILSFRFIYGVRNFASFGIGCSRVPWSRFVWLNFIAAGVWAASFSGFGYLFGQAFEHMLGDVGGMIGKFALGLFVTLMLAPLLVRYIVNQIRRRRGVQAP